MSIRRINKDRSHWYEDTETGERVPGVTTIISRGVPKPALIDWAANSTAEYALDHWERLSELPPSVRLKELRRARWALRDSAANRGSAVHALAERLVRGEQVSVPDEIAGWVENYVTFLDDFDVRSVVVEGVVYSRQYGYCGTLDLIADLLDPFDPEPLASRRRTRWLLDLKTSSGVYGEVGLQLAGYRYADVLVDEENGEETPVPAVEKTGVVHVRADGYDLIPVQAGPEQHQDLVHAMRVARFVDGARELVGDPIPSPQTSTYRLVCAIDPDTVGADDETAYRIDTRETQ